MSVLYQTDLQTSMIVLVPQALIQVLSIIKEAVIMHSPLRK